MYPSPSSESDLTLKQEPKTKLSYHFQIMYGTISTSPEVPKIKKTAQVMQDDKFFSRLLSKETSMANPSFRVYHGGLSGAVPFMWESQPGTPKHASCESSLPPLTPPPSYYSNSTKKPAKNQSRSNLLQSLWFLKIIQRKTDGSSSSPTSLSLSSSSSSSSPPWSSSKHHGGRRSKFSSRGSSFDSRMDYEEEEAATARSPTSTLCFGIGKGLRSQRQHQHCH